VSVEKNRRTAACVDGLTYEVMDAEATTFPNESFDLIGGVGILHHLDLQRCCTEISRLLKEGGSAIFVEPLGHNPLLNCFRALTPQLRTRDEHPLLMRDLQSLTAFFGDVRVEFYYLTALGAVLLPAEWACRAAVKVLNPLDQMLFRFLPFLRKHAWSVVLTITKAPRTESARIRPPMPAEYLDRRSNDVEVA
jgi:SAM-dependent methyltransferase